MTEIILITGMALVTFLIRYPMFAIAGRVQFPAPLTRALRYVPPVVLTAIIVPAVVMPQGTVDLSLTNAYLLGAIIAFGVGWVTRNLLLTIVIGMAAFLALQWFLV